MNLWQLSKVTIEGRFRITFAGRLALERFIGSLFRRW